MKQRILKTTISIMLLSLALSAFGQEDQQNNNSQNNKRDVDPDYFHPNNDPNLDKHLSNDPSKTEGGAAASPIPPNNIPHPISFPEN